MHIEAIIILFICGDIFDSSNTDNLHRFWHLGSGGHGGWKSIPLNNILRLCRLVEHCFVLSVCFFVAVVAAANSSTVSFFCMMPSNAELACEVQHLRTEISQLRESVSVMNAFYEKTKRKQDSVTTENKSLQTLNDQLTAKITDMKQLSRINIIEIKGVP